MRDVVQAILEDATRAVRRWRIRPGIKKLLDNHSPLINSIATGIHEAVNGVLSDQERHFISAIEEQRKLLLQDQRSIVYIDYGAGHQGTRRSVEEMMRGVAGSTSIGKICQASKPPFWALLLFKLIRQLRPESCIELGTCVGISASYQGSALLLNETGRMITLEGSPEIAQVAIDTLARIGLRNVRVVTGPFHSTLQASLESAMPVDFMFIDGHHDYAATLDYFRRSKPFLRAPAVLVFDDISWSTGMRRAWHEIERDDNVSYSIDLHKMGVALLSERKADKDRLRIPFF